MDPDPTAEAERTLTELHRLRDRAARRAHGGAWLPAAAVAALLLASAALYEAPFAPLNAIDAEHPFWAGLPDQQRQPVLSYVYWFVGIPLLFAGSAGWYRWRARRLGVRVAWPAFVGTGLGVLALLAVIAAVPTRPAPDGLTVAAGPYWPGLLSPLLPLAATVLVLGWAERSRGLVAAGVWIVLLTGWLCTTYPLGTIPAWALGTDSLGGQLGLRPGHYLVLMALPLIAVSAARLASARRA
ncbi:hypothetical protein GA0070606_0762 [Micromonospora citrea]|uniref:Uncharacterized protein n=1 Tax=Micromonospora citrea TaxID=47855 RepID=A0A1C6TUX2_9ACTN|nr:hypothetical protein [Micromonospora citrea]SCL45479.1 hypothetical protein GA0070606_0762 [Micromonospora citrea]